MWWVTGPVLAVCVAVMGQCPVEDAECQKEVSQDDSIKYIIDDPSVGEPRSLFNGGIFDSIAKMFSGSDKTNREDNIYNQNLYPEMLPPGIYPQSNQLNSYYPTRKSYTQNPDISADFTQKKPHPSKRLKKKKTANGLRLSPGLLPPPGPQLINYQIPGQALLHSVKTPIVPQSLGLPNNNPVKNAGQFPYQFYKPENNKVINLNTVPNKPPHNLHSHSLPQLPSNTNPNSALHAVHNAMQSAFKQTLPNHQSAPKVYFPQTNSQKQLDLEQLDFYNQYLPVSYNQRVVRNPNTFIQPLPNVHPSKFDGHLHQSLQIVPSPEQDISIQKEPSFFDSLAEIAGGIFGSNNQKKQPVRRVIQNVPFSKINPERPFPSPHRVVLTPNPIQAQRKSFNGFVPSPQEGNSLTDAFQPIFKASQSLDEELPHDAMKPIIVHEPSSPSSHFVKEELIDFF